MPDTKTKDRLATELRAIAAKAQPCKAATYLALADRAVAGEFGDYSDVHACGPTALYQLLKDLGFDKFANRVANGEFDASAAESDEWANSVEGRAAMKDFTPEQRAALFGVFDA